LHHHARRPKNDFARSHALVLADFKNTISRSKKWPSHDGLPLEFIGHDITTDLFDIKEMFLRYDSVDATDTWKAVDPMEGFLKCVDQTVDQTPLKVKEG
jgi:hypothetical protein